MKKIPSSRLVLFAILLLSSVFFFTSCTKEELQAPQSVKNYSESQIQTAAATNVSSKTFDEYFNIPGGGHAIGPYVIHSMTQPGLNLVLDVPDGSPVNGRIIQQYPYNGGENLKWEILRGPNGYYQIYNVATDKCLDVPNGSIAPGVKIQQYKPNGGVNQDWIIEALPNSAGNIVMIRSRASGLALTVPNLSTSPGTQIEQWLPLKQKNQTWRLVSLMFGQTYHP